MCFVFLLKKKYSLRLVLPFLFFIPLLISLLLIFLFAYKPCVLCLYQLSIYILGFFLSSSFSLIAFYYKSNVFFKSNIFLFLFSCLLLLLEGGLASYQIMLEKGYIYFGSCTNIDIFSSISSYYLSDCNHANYIFSLTIAEWNLFYVISAFIVVFSLLPKLSIEDK